MDPITIMALADAAITLLEKAVPEIEKAFNQGLISVEDQKAQADRLAALRDKHFAFTRPGE